MSEAMIDALRRLHAPALEGLLIVCPTCWAPDEELQSWPCENAEILWTKEARAFLLAPLLEEVEILTAKIAARRAERQAELDAGARPTMNEQVRSIYEKEIAHQLQSISVFNRLCSGE